MVNRGDLKKLVSMYYDVQDIRIRTVNRMRRLNVDYNLDPEFLKKFELLIADRIRELIKDEPIYTEFLSKIKGLGPVLSGAIIAYFDPSKAEHVSSFWKYAGLHVVNGEAPRRTRGRKTEWNPKVKTLCWKIGMSFLKAKTPFYSDLYYEFKDYENNKLNNPIENYKNCPLWQEGRCKAKGTPACKQHIHLRALRKMVKRFLSDLWIKWRKLEGLPVTEPYVIDVLKHNKEESPYL